MLLTGVRPEHAAPSAHHGASPQPGDDLLAEEVHRLEDQLLRDAASYIGLDDDA